MLKLMEFHRSSNCAKVRIALNYKGIPFEMEEMSSADRTPLVEAAHWPLVPVIVDGEVAMRDSEAILHYLESNYRDTPSLTPAGIDDLRHGDALLFETRARFQPVLRKVYRQALKMPEERDPQALDGIEDEITRAVEPLERELDGKRFLLGDHMTYFDILVGAPLQPLRPRPDYAAQSPMWAFFGEHLSLPSRFRNVHAWLDRVLAFDHQPADATA